MELGRPWYIKKLDHNQENTLCGWKSVERETMFMVDEDLPITRIDLLCLTMVDCGLAALYKLDIGIFSIGMKL
jgi:hypothetical protein